MILQERANKVNAQKEIEAVAAFLIGEAEYLASFLTGSNKYMTFGISLTKYACDGSLNLEVHVYQEDKTHEYLDHLQKEDLINKINALHAQEEKE